MRIKARSKRRSIYAPNLANELSRAGERHLNQLSSVRLIRFGTANNIKLRRVCRTMRRWSSGLGPVHTYSDIFVSATFLLRIGLSSTCIRSFPAGYLETFFESALQSGNFFIRKQLGYVWTVKSVNIFIR